MGTEILCIDGKPEKVILTFPTKGKPGEWRLMRSKLLEYHETFKPVDVLAEAKKALQWARDNSGKRKTARRMPAFLSRWLTNANDKGTAAMLPDPDKPTGPELLYEERDPTPEDIAEAYGIPVEEVRRTWNESEVST